MNEVLQVALSSLGFIWFVSLQRLDHFLSPLHSFTQQKLKEQNFVYKVGVIGSDVTLQSNDRAS